MPIGTGVFSHTPFLHLCVPKGAEIFFPRVRTPCGHGAQVIIEGREIQSDGGEKDKDNTTTKNNRQPQPKGRVSTIL